MNTLSHYVDIISLKLPRGSFDERSYVSTDNMNVDAGGIEFGKSAVPSGKSTRYTVGDVLFSNIRTYFRKVWKADRDGACSNDVLVFRAKPDVLDARYLYYTLTRPDFTEYSVRTSKGAKMPRGDKKAILGFPLSIPDLKQQREIASILGALDDKIELNRRMAATLEEMARVLYRSWFVDFDPVKAKAEGLAPAFMDEATAALFPDRFREDGLPEGWETQFLLDQSLWVNGAAYKDMHFSDAPDALPVIKIAELKVGITGNTKFTATDLGERFRITRGELLFSWSGNPDTSIDAFIWSLGEAWLNQHIFAVRPNGRMSKAMLFTCLRFFKPEMAEIARNKQTTGLGHITRKDLEAFPVSVAPRPVMSAFDERLFPIFDRYCECLFETQTLKELRDTLLPKLMSGELRVGEARDQIEEVA